MFGGHGLYRDGVMFALLLAGGLYLKVDGQSRHHFAGRNLRPFAFVARGRTVELSYHAAPPEALEEAPEMAVWCQRAWEASLRAREQARGRGPRSGRRDKGVCKARAASAHGRVVPPQRASLMELPNLGPRSVDALAAVRITSLFRLRHLGAVRAFLRVRARQPNVSLNLLWALEGALTGRRWQEVARTDRASLLMALEDAQRESA